MRIKKKRICVFMIAALVLVLYGCSGVLEASRPSSEDVGNEVAIAASFQQEDGEALSGSTVRFAYEESSVDHTLNDHGELEVSGLPRTGDLTLTVLDSQEQAQGAMTLSLSEGAVIDATTDTGGVGHVTLRGDTEEVALFFTLKKDGSLLCSLSLS